MKDNRQMPFKADKPYNELPPLPPNQEVETRAVLKKCITARAALAELKQALRYRSELREGFGHRTFRHMPY